MVGTRSRLTSVFEDLVQKFDGQSLRGPFHFMAASIREDAAVASVVAITSLEPLLRGLQHCDNLSGILC